MNDASHTGFVHPHAYRSSYAYIYIFIYEKNEGAESNYILCMGGDSKKHNVETFEQDSRDLQC